jgi:type I restriction enzyme S subunit
LFTLWLQEPELALSGTGSTFTAINKNDLEEIEINVPPLAEQKRIVTKVEALLARVNAARERLARVPVILKRFRQAVLAAACSGQLTEEWRTEHQDLEPVNQLLERVCAKRLLRKVEVTDLPEIPEEWTWVYLPDLGYMNRGKSRHRPRDASHLYGGPYPFIQTGDIAQSGGRITSHRQAYSEEGLAQSRMWSAGTVCITIAANIANSAILTYPACFPDSVVGVIPDENLCLAEYLEFFIRTARADLDQFAPATAQKNINIGILSDVAVPLPHLTEQHEIVRRVEALFKLADTIEKRVAAATARAEKLTQAVLAKAFRGELVPTEAELARREGRDYEPAAILLARIRAELAARVESAPTRRNSGRSCEGQQERRRAHSRAPLHRKD